jgi:hypothetical protein
MKKEMSLILLLAVLAIPTQSDGWVAWGGGGYRGVAVVRPPYWHAGWGCGGVCTGTAVAAGAAGFVAGAAVGAAMARPTVVVTPPPVVIAPVPAVPLGTIHYFLPYGAQPIAVGGQQYYTLGGTYYQPFFGNNGVYYQVVAPPI